MTLSGETSDSKGFDITAESVCNCRKVPRPARRESSGLVIVEAGGQLLGCLYGEMCERELL